AASYKRASSLPWIAPDGADHHMAAIAAEARIAAVCHAGRHCGRDGGVDRVAVLTQNCHARFGRSG
ncbi:MAG TPA: hypothetical protein VE258_17900, partial [Ktedonobacterales bacterium]|nr:hypothetical protein [Ktedonobacterales bacterium]